ncbi:hypothetical protein [Sphingobacterium kitahiroshimense]|uniref:hypothetical protein n=1 Tax=Sphingobacterium kitahiroshimense TaxID=470446 RepID=UPI003207C04A
MEYRESNKRLKKSWEWNPDEILVLLQEFEACKSEIGLIKFCQERQLSCTTFRSWIKKHRSDGLSGKGRFIELPLTGQPQVGVTT